MSCNLKFSTLVFAFQGPLEHADDDVVVGRVANSVQHHAATHAGPATPPPENPAQVRPPGRQAARPPRVRVGLPTAEGGDSGNACHAESSSERVLDDGPKDDGVLDDATPGDAADPPRSGVLEDAATPSTSASPSSSEDSDDSDDDSAVDAGGDVEDEVVTEDAAFGIQELSLTVSHKPHRAVSSVTLSSVAASSMTGVSSMTRRDSAGDSDPEDAYTMEAIKKALRRTRPPR